MSIGVFIFWIRTRNAGIGIERQMTVEMRIAWSISACSKSEPEECVRGDRVESGGGAMSDVEGEVKLPEGPASSDDRTREPVLLEAVITSRMVSAKASSFIGVGSGPG